MLTCKLLNGMTSGLRGIMLEIPYGDSILHVEIFLISTDKSLTTDDKRLCSKQLHSIKCVRKYGIEIAKLVEKPTVT